MLCVRIRKLKVLCIDTNCIYGQNIRGKSILVGDDTGVGENDRIRLFSDPDLVEAAANCRRVSIDGTFKGSSKKITLHNTETNDAKNATRL